MSTDALSNNESLRERLIGSWRLVSYEARNADGRRVIYPLGEDAKGYILYTPDGFMSAQIMQLDRPPFHAADLSGGTDAESAHAARGYLAYSGAYHVEDDSLVVHEAEVSLFPNWVDETQARKAALIGRRLELSTTAPISYGDEQLTAVLVWEPA
jgi:hypothetical protein